MKNFTINNTNYTTTTNGYFYKEEAGKKSRISKKEYEQALAAFEAEEAKSLIVETKEIESDNPAAPKVILQKRDDKDNRYWAKRADDPDTEFVPVSMKMLVDEKLGHNAAGFNFLGHTYWYMRGKDPKAPKDTKAAKKTKKSKKNVFHTSTSVEGLTLTEKQVSFLLHLPDTAFWEEGLDSVVWVDCLADEIGGQFKNNPFLVGAMVSTLREKGLVAVNRDESRKGKPAAMALTENGKIVAREVGLEG